MTPCCNTGVMSLKSDRPTRDQATDANGRKTSYIERLEKCCIQSRLNLHEYDIGLLTTLFIRNELVLEHVA